jgi:hypothetical protein
MAACAGAACRSMFAPNAASKPKRSGAGVGEGGGGPPAAAAPATSSSAKAHRMVERGLPGLKENGSAVPSWELGLRVLRTTKSTAPLQKISLSAFVVLDRSLTVLFTFTPAVTSVAAFVGREARLASLLKVGGLPVPGAPPIALAVDDVVVALAHTGDLVYAAFANAGDDELAAVELLTGAFAVLAATCEEAVPSAPRVADFYGKIIVCLHEAFGGQGFQFQRDTDVILKNAKLKA